MGLIFPMYDMNIKEWSLGINSLGNSVTGILNNQKNKTNYIFAGETDNPNDIFILTTGKKVFFKEPARIIFDYYHAGIHGEIKICLDNFNTCPFSYSSRNLTINARKWQKGEIIIPEISKHRIIIYANGLINNYFIGFDNIRLTQLSTLKAAQCS
uniref:Astacin domain-containing protein n=1 Tax=Strongyloides papillosus TaxID=174720 RepID=A0A0N5C5S4_STREA